MAKKNKDLLPVAKADPPVDPPADDESPLSVPEELASIPTIRTDEPNPDAPSVRRRISGAELQQQLRQERRVKRLAEKGY